MAAGFRRPPLPAPTDISFVKDDNSALDLSDDLETNISHISSKTHYTIPEDGSPVTITTQKHRDGKKESSTSLLIELYEGHKTGQAPTSRPSLRVRVTPSASKRFKKGRDHIRISESTKTGKPAAVRRISIPGADSESHEFSSSSEVSSTRPPVEVEVFHAQDDFSELNSHSNISHLVQNRSDVSSLPPDSMLDASIHKYSPKGFTAPGLEKENRVSFGDSLKAPDHNASSHRKSRERVTRRDHGKTLSDSGTLVHEYSSRRKSSTSSGRSSRSTRTSKETAIAEDAIISKSRPSKHREEGREPSLHQSEVSGVSSRSGTSGISMNNPKLLSTVEDLIKKLILPELNAVKEEQRAMKNRHKFEDLSRSSSTVARRDEEHSLVKSSSLPTVSNGRRLEITANDRGLIHSETSRSSRRSSRESAVDRTSEHSNQEGHLRRRSNSDKKNTRTTAMAAGITGAAVVGLAGALAHKSSSSTINKERRRRSSESQGKSRSQSISGPHADLVGRGNSHSPVPSMPMNSQLDSELTRASILSAETEQTSSLSSNRATTPARQIRQVSRGSIQQVQSSSTRDALYSPVRSPSDYSVEDVMPDGSVTRDTKSPSTGRTGISSTGLGAAAAAATALLHPKYSQDHLTFPVRHRKTSPSDDSHGFSPVHSEASFQQHDEVIQHPRVRSIRSSHSISSDKRVKKASSPMSAHSPPATHPSKPTELVNFESTYEILPEDEHSPHTPQADEIEQWLQQEHEANDKLREQIDHDSLSAPDAANHRDTIYTEGSTIEEYVTPLASAQQVRYIGAKPQYIHTSPAVESAVGSLQETTALSLQSSNKSSPTKVGPVSQPGPLPLDDSYHPSPENNLPVVGSKQRWEAVRDCAMALTSRMDSPAQSETRSIDETPVMAATYVPGLHDMPEIGVVPDDDSEMITNPSVVDGQLGGQDYQPTPNMHRMESLHMASAALVGAGAKRAQYQAFVEDAGEMNEHGISAEETSRRGYIASPAPTKDEGYISANYPISPVHKLVARADDGDGDGDYYGTPARMDEEDPFTTSKSHKHASGLSHGMATPLYDSATGRGVDRIESKDVVALMDHLTVRDAQRNARDTEILVTLVRSAAEMRNSFEDMKRFIIDQDELIMRNMDRAHDNTVHRVLSGPRPFPKASSKTQAKLQEEEEDMSTKRRNIFRRALKGLGSRSTNDFAKIEEMLNTLLSEVEGLKEIQAGNPSQTQTRPGSLNSYEHLRAAPDPGYEPEGRAGTNSSPTQSGFLSNSSSRHLMHSGYELKRGTESHRISTLPEDDEEEADDLVGVPRAGQATTKTSQRSLRPDETDLPIRSGWAETSQSHEPASKTNKTRGKLKSGTALFNSLPKMSRWSKTTTSTVPDSVRNSSSKKEYMYSPAFYSGSNAQLDYDYEMDDDEAGRYRDTCANRPSSRKSQQRSVSPLIPDYELDDPKYQVHRNSQNLEHPQPRPGPTYRHQNHLETQAIDYENPPTPDADHIWGSEPALAKGRFVNVNAARSSPIHSEDGDDHYSSEEEGINHHGQGRRSNEGPLIPSKAAALTSTEPVYGSYDVPMMNSGMHIASPLEPIEEVRKSLETDRSSIRPEMTPSPRPSAITRKLTGPREMPRNASSSSYRRHSSQTMPDSPASYETYRTSLDSEAF